jgi:hypothetical protein
MKGNNDEVLATPLVAAEVVLEDRKLNKRAVVDRILEFAVETRTSIEGTTEVERFKSLSLPNEIAGPSS